MKFLSGCKLFGIITEVELGVFFARLVATRIFGTKATGGKASDLRLSDEFKPHAASLEVVVREKEGTALIADLRAAGLSLRTGSQA
jgi:hypothetical protein